MALPPDGTTIKLQDGDWKKLFESSSPFSRMIAAPACPPDTIFFLTPARPNEPHLHGYSIERSLVITNVKVDDE